MPERLAAGTSLGLSIISATKAPRRRRAGAGLIEPLEGRVLLSAGSWQHHRGPSVGSTSAGTTGTTTTSVSAPVATTAPIATPSATTTTTTTSANGVPVAMAAVTPSVTNPIAGDANSDGVVDLADFKQVVSYYNVVTRGATWAQGDFNGDGAVNYADMLLYQANYGKTGGTPITQTGGGDHCGGDASANEHHVVGADHDYQGRDVHGQLAKRQSEHAGGAIPQ